MRSTRMTGLALAALTFAAASSAGEPRIGKFTQYETGSYTIISSRSGAQAREFMEGLAKYRVTLEKTLQTRAANTNIPTIIVIVSHTEWTKYLQPRPNIAGWFQRGHFANYMVMDGDADPVEALHVIFHEYTHFFLATQFPGEYPPWFNEGIAELMSYAMFTKKGMAVLQLPPDRMDEARDKDWIPFDRMIKVDMRSPEYIQHKLMDAFYAQAWLTVHYGMVENRAFGKQMFEYLHQLNTLHPQEEAARNIFGADLTVVDQQLRDYSRKNNKMSGGISIGELPPVTLTAGKPMAELDAMATIIDLMLATRSPPDRVRPLIESLARREPKSPRPSIFAARLAQLDEDNAAFERAVVQAESLIGPDDWQMHRDLASALLASASDFNPLSIRTSEENQRNFKRAMKWFGEAIAHNNEDVEALWGFGTSASRLNKNLDLAETALLAAYQRAPRNTEIAMSLAELKSRKQEPDEMIPYLKDCIRYGHDLSTIQWAAETLLQTQNYIEERNRVDAENKKQHAAYEKQLADYEKKYGKKKKK